MDLIARIKHRIGYVWHWRVRYWWMDTRQGQATRVLMAALGLIGMIGEGARVVFLATQPVDPAKPRESVIIAIVLLIVALLIAVIALATMPKPKPPQPQKADTPTVEDGQAVKDHGGTFVVDDSFILAWKQMETEPIMAKGGK